MLSSLFGKLTIHLAIEDKSLYPQLKSHADAAVRATAARFDAEKAAIAPAVHAFGRRWSEPAIRENAAAFRAETRKLFAALAARIKRENNGSTRSPAAASPPRPIARPELGKMPGRPAARRRPPSTNVFCARSIAALQQAIARLRSGICNS